MIVCIQIGNSDDKLTQKDWSDYVQRMQSIVATYAAEIHFSGTSEGSKPWQNACWVLSIPSRAIDRFEEKVVAVRERFNQESVAITTGSTRFI